jgi:hypothetical protein
VSKRSGDKARFNRELKKKLPRREVNRELQKTLGDAPLATRAYSSKPGKSERSRTV